MSGIVVGTDGSKGAKVAVDWAAKEAQLRSAPLTVVVAWQWLNNFYGEGEWAGIDQEVIDGFLELGEQRLKDTLSSVSADFPGVQVDGRTVEGPAAAVLLEAAKDADLLVVGTRGHGGFAGVLLGSVSQQVVHHSPCAVVVVPPPEK